MSDKLKMMKEKIIKGKQQSQPIQTQNNVNIENTVNKVQKQKQQQPIAKVNVQLRSQSEQQMVNKTISQSIVPKQTLQIMKNTQLYQKLMNLKLKQKKLFVPIQQKQHEKVQKSVGQVVKQPIPMPNQNSQEVKTQDKNKEFSLKLMMQKLKKSKSEQNQTTFKPQQKPFSQIKHQKQAPINQNDERKSVEINKEQAGSPEVVNQHHQPLIKSSSALDQGQKFPWAKSVNIPVCQSNLSNQNNSKSQNPVEEILEIIKKTSQQNFVQNLVFQPYENAEQPEQIVVVQLVKNIEWSLQNVQKPKLGQPNNLQLQEQEPREDIPQVQNYRSIGNQPQEGIVENLPIQNPQQEAQPQIERQAEPDIQREQEVTQKRQPEQQISLEVQPLRDQTLQDYEKQKPKQESKLVQRLNTMMENLKKIKEKQNKQIADLSKSIANNQVEKSANKNEVQQINQGIVVSKAEESGANQEDFQEQQKLEEEEEDIQEKEVIEREQKFSKRQQKRTKVFLKQIAKLGEITQKIQNIISQKYTTDKNVKQNTSSGLIDLFRKIQVALKND